MKLNIFSIAVPITLTVLEVHGAIQQVTVGASGFTFSPDSLTAAVGDVIEFSIQPGHSVTQSSFSDPCHPVNTSAVFSGFPSGGSDDVFSVTINSTDPIWFYCATPSHCQSGMVMAINAPSSGNTLAAYKTAASSASDSTSPNNVQGGIFAPAAQASSTASSAASATASSSAPSSTGQSSGSAYGSMGTESAHVSLGFGALILSLTLAILTS